MSNRPTFWQETRQNRPPLSGECLFLRVDSFHLFPFIPRSFCCFRVTSLHLLEMIRPTVFKQLFFLPPSCVFLFFSALDIVLAVIFSPACVKTDHLFFLYMSNRTTFSCGYLFFSFDPGVSISSTFLKTASSLSVTFLHLFASALSRFASQPSTFSSRQKTRESLDI